MKKGLLLCVLMLNLVWVSAQDLRGKWVNTTSTSEDFDEMTLKTLNNGIYSGDSYDGGYGGDFCKYTFKAKYDPVKNEFLGRDVVLIDKTENHGPVAYRLQYRRDGNQEYLEGYGRLINEDGSLGYPFRVRYYKEAPKEVKYTPTEEEVAIIKQYKQTRKNPKEGQIRLNTPSILVRVHDYGKEDHDSISIIYNDELIAYKIPIDSQDKEYEIALQPDQNNRLTFIAHNLGDVAPNTTYVEILADDKVFKYTLFTDLQKNAVIDLRLNP